MSEEQQIEQTAELEAEPEAVEEQDSSAEADVESTGEESEQDDAGPGPGDEETEHDKRGLLEALQAERRKRQEYQQFVEQIRQSESQPAPPAQPQFGPEGPRLEQFENYDDYQRALIRHEASAIASQQAQQYARQQAVQTFEQRLSKVEGRPKDFRKVIEEVFTDQSLPISQAMAQAILTDEAGPDMAYYLKSNQRELQKLASMAPLQQAVEMGKLAAKLQQQPPKPTNAPPAVNPVRGSKGAAHIDPDKMSTSEWIAWRNKQTSARRRR